MEVPDFRIHSYDRLSRERTDNISPSSDTDTLSSEIFRWKFLELLQYFFRNFLNSTLLTNQIWASPDLPFKTYNLYADGPFFWQCQHLMFTCPFDSEFDLSRPLSPRSVNLPLTVMHLLKNRIRFSLFREQSENS